MGWDTVHATARIPTSTSLADVTFCVVDIETTGGSGADSITEVAALKVRCGEELGAFETLVACEGEIPPSIVQLTGITTAMVSDAPYVEEVLPHLLEFAHGCVIVGHNVRFDLRFLNGELLRSGYTAFDCPVLDTLALARRLITDEAENCRLGTLADRLGLEHRPTHRAMTDVRATVDLLHALIERSSGYGVRALDDLLALPRTAAHAQARKLGWIGRMPRTPGVVLAHGPGEEIIHLDATSNLRRRARTWFAIRDGRRIGPMLREAQRFSWIETADRAAAEALEAELLVRHRPRYRRRR